MTCEEYVVERAKTLESNINKLTEENTILLNKLYNYESVLVQLKNMLEFKDDSEYRKITLSVYEKYDKENFDMLNAVFNFVDDTDVAITAEEE